MSSLVIVPLILGQRPLGVVFPPFIIPQNIIKHEIDSNMLKNHVATGQLFFFGSLMSFGVAKA